MFVLHTAMDVEETDTCREATWGKGERDVMFDAWKAMNQKL
jgi:hypothetical protein